MHSTVLAVSVSSERLIFFQRRPGTDMGAEKAFFNDKNDANDEVDAGSR
jgi:hypothetical protein